MNVLNENVMINVFDMLIKRIDSLQDSVNKTNSYLLNEARYKTNNIICGSIFNYPFEIHNYKYDKKMYAYIQIKLHHNKNNMSLYDNWWDIWNSEDLSKSNSMTQKLKIFMVDHFGNKMFNDIEQGIKDYFRLEDDTFITCKYYGIDSLYDYLPEYILNIFMTNHEKIPGFKSFNHIEDTININFRTPHRALYIDELIDYTLARLECYGYKRCDIACMKIVGLDYAMHHLISFYDMNVECVNKEKQENAVKEYIEKLCSCTRDKLRSTVIEHGAERPMLPIFSNIDNAVFILNVLDS